jgi:hypothetical protein
MIKKINESLISKRSVFNSINSQIPPLSATKKEKRWKVKWPISSVNVCT